MKYLFLICDDETVQPTPAEVEANPDHRAWLERMTERGAYLEGARLRPASDATTVQVRDGEMLVSDGPFAETKDLVGGFVLAECADLDEALELAALHPVAQYGRVEVRPIWE